MLHLLWIFKSLKLKSKLKWFISYRKTRWGVTWKELFPHFLSENPWQDWTNTESFPIKLKSTSQLWMSQQPHRVTLTERESTRKKKEKRMCLYVCTTYVPLYVVHGWQKTEGCKNWHRKVEKKKSYLGTQAQQTPMSGWWNIPNCTCFLNSADSDLLVCFRDVLSVSSQKNKGLHRAVLTLLFVFSLPFFWMSVWIAFHSHASCVEDALNPVQGVVGGTHTEWLAPRAESDLPLFHALQHTEGPAFCKIVGEWVGSLCSTGIGRIFCQSSLNSPSSVFFFLLVELKPHACFPFYPFCLLCQNWSRI